jgi:hypothetical protein
MVKSGSNAGVVNALMALAACAVLVYIVFTYNKSRTDTYVNNTAPCSQLPLPNDPSSQPYLAVDYPQPRAQETPVDCFPKDRLTAADLLPKDAANEQWAQANPAGQGDVSDQNFLTAGHHAGVDTIGSSLKIANLDIRSTPPNPRHTVSPWLQSTVEPDLNRRPFEIGSGAC